MRWRMSLPIPQTGWLDEGDWRCRIGEAIDHRQATQTAWLGIDAKTHMNRLHDLAPCSPGSMMTCCNQRPPNLMTSQKSARTNRIRQKHATRGCQGHPTDIDSRFSSNRRCQSNVPTQRTVGPFDPPGKPALLPYGLAPCSATAALARLTGTTPWRGETHFVCHFNRCYGCDLASVIGNLPSNTDEYLHHGAIQQVIYF